MLKYLIIFSFLSSYILAAQKSYDGYKVFKITPSSLNGAALLRNLENEDGVDFWDPIHYVENYPVRVMVSPEKIDFVSDYLLESNLNYEVVIENVEQTVEFERNDNAAKRRTSRIMKRTAVADFTFFYTVDELHEYLDELVATYPDLVEIEILGQSLEGRDVRAVKISLPGRRVDGSRPTILADSLLHAREWIGLSVTMKLIHELVVNSAQNLDILQNIDWIIVPIANPDGYDFSHTSDRFWRKTRSPIENSLCTGVDGNRNFDFQWDVRGGASNIGCAQTFRGPNPFSEIEVQYLAELMRRFDNTLLYLSIHSFGNWWLYPWGYDFVPISNADVHQTVGQDAVNAILAVNGTSYTLGIAAELLYIASGASDDYAAGVGQIPHVFTIELPSGGSRGFDIEPSRIAGVVAETWPALQVCGRFVSSLA